MTENEKQDLKVRTKQFALRIIRLYTSLPKTTEAQVMGRQVLNSGTSVGAQYREAQRAKLKVLCKNWMKRFIGLNCSGILESFLLKS